MIRIAVCEDNLDELQTQKKMVQSIMQELSKTLKFLGFKMVRTYYLRWM